MNVQISKRYSSGPKRSKKEILIEEIIQLKPEFTINQLSRLDLPTLNIILDTVKLNNTLKPQLNDREQYIADLLRFANGVSSLELNKLPTVDLKFLSIGYWSIMKVKNDCIRDLE